MADPEPAFDMELILELHRRGTDALSALHSVAIDGLVQLTQTTCAIVTGQATIYIEPEDEP